MAIIIPGAYEACEYPHDSTLLKTLITYNYIEFLCDAAVSLRHRLAQLLQLQGLHPLPGLVLEYRQVKLVAYQPPTAWPF